MKNLMVCLYLFILFSTSCHGEDIQGIYRQEGSPIGIEIRKTESQGYIVQEIFLNNDNKVISELEWQAAYIAEISDKNIFYWHTGRHDEDNADSNSLIVYEVEFRNNSIIGFYFFPEEPLTPPAEVRFSRVVSR